MKLKEFPFHQQIYRADCGPTCLRMVAQYYGKFFNPYKMKYISRINREGASLLDLTKTAEKIGFRATGLRIKPEFLKEIDLPVILHWDLNHFVVLFEIKNMIYCIADPSKGILEISESELLRHWQHKENNKGIILALSSTS